MKNIVINKKVLIFAGTTLLAIIGVAVAVWLLMPRSGLNIIYAPQSSNVTINGKKAGAKNKVQPGKYKVVVSKDGFASATEEVDVKEGETVEVNIALESNAYYTANWYRDHPKDAQIRERIAFQRYEDELAVIHKNFPIIDVLPYVPEERTWRIDYGISEDPTTQRIIISYYTDIGKERALKWIASKGYDIDDYEVEYKQRRQGEWWP